MAAEAFARAVEKDPGKLQLRFRLVDALLQAGDRIRVGPACDDILKRFGKSTDPLQAMEVAGLCRLALQASENPSKRQAVHELAPLPTDRLQRAEVLAKFGQLDLVASGFAKKREAEPGSLYDEIDESFKQFVSLVAMGDLPGYRSAADKVTSNWDHLPTFALSNRAWLCTFAPDAVTDLTVPVQMAEKFFAAQEPAERQKSSVPVPTGHNAISRWQNR